MPLTAAQKVTLKTAILADSGANAFYSIGNLDGLASHLNTAISPSFWVWRTSVSRAEIYNDTSPDGTTWNWQTYKGQAIAEQNAWVQMFMGDAADFSKANLRAGVSNIFGASNAQTTHVLAMGRRPATFAEKVLATGTGSTGSPATMGFEGAVSVSDLVSL